MTSHHDADAIVIGAGLAGLAISRQLHRLGVDFVTLEQRPAFTQEGFAINLPGNAIAALQDMGLGDGISALGCPTKRRAYRDHRGRLLFEVDEDRFWGPDFRPRCVKRSALAELLRTGLPATVLSMSSRLDGIGMDDNAITVTTTGLAGARALRGQIVIGADGVHSRTRTMALPDVRLRAALLSPSSWRFVAPDPGVDCWTVWAGPGAMFLLIPLGNGEVYGWACSADAIVQREYGLAGVFHDFPPEVRRIADFLDAHPRRLHHSPLEEVRPTVWGKERIVLIGDAAHATSPVWAQGGALAFEDANALGAILAGGADWSNAAVRLETVRRQRVGHVQSMTDKMSRAARLPAVVRNLLLPFVGPRRYRATYAPLRTEKQSPG
jgi:2-polyprenyl-6-methoxyphenol hydroxylase-like FAD-dependent oxidoreductase